METSPNHDLDQIHCLNYSTTDDCVVQNDKRGVWKNFYPPYVSYMVSELTKALQSTLMDSCTASKGENAVLVSGSTPPSESSRAKSKLP